MSLYNDLGISPDADSATIKRAYRGAAKRLHPDNADTGDRAGFERVNRAYVVLSDPDRRERYDRTGEEDDPRDHALNHLANILEQAFAHAVDLAGANFEGVDLIASCRDIIESLSGQHADNKRLAEREIAKVEKIVKRLKRSDGDGPDILGGILAGRIDGLRRGIDHAEAEIGRMDAALEYLGSYRFDVDVMPGWQTIKVTTGTGTWI